MTALSAHDFAQQMHGCGIWPDKPRLAVAVSGGPDSIALTFLLHAWVTQRGGTLHAITIDHQLRAESAGEAQQVAAWCHEKNISHETLVWEKDVAPQSGMHEQARNARYHLLITACKKQNIDHLFLGHHADDQAETVFMRFLKGSGIDGLAGMPRTRRLDGLYIHRPFLPVLKQHLIDTCNTNGWRYVNDPSNHSQHYMRGKLRNLEDGFNTPHLYDIARSAGMARAALEETANQWLSMHATVHPFGVIDVNLTQWKTLNAEQKRRTLIRLLLCISGEDYPPRSASLETLITHLETWDTVNQTLSGCRIVTHETILQIYREEAALPKPMPLNNGMLWDNRFRIYAAPELLDKDLRVAPLGHYSRDALETMNLKEVALLHAAHRASLPALVHNHVLHSVPPFGQSIGDGQPVSAIFLPKRMLIIEPFAVCPPLF